MITDDERREIAKRLREKKKEFFGKRRWFPQDLTSYQSMYLTAIDECLPDGECGFDVLADLIDRPRGRALIPDAMEGGVFCPRCGAEIGEYGVPNYCHNCGLAITNGH